MKKLIALLLLAAPLWAGTYTTRSGIYKPADGDTGWGSHGIRDSYDIIDSSFGILSGTQTWTAPQTFTGGVVLEDISFTGPQGTFSIQPDSDHSNYYGFISTESVIFHNTMTGANSEVVAWSFSDVLGPSFPTNSGGATSVAISPSITTVNTGIKEVTALQVSPNFSVAKAPTQGTTAISINPTFGGTEGNGAVHTALRIGDRQGVLNNITENSTSTVNFYGIFTDLSNLQSTMTTKTSGYFQGGKFEIVGSTHNAYTLLVGTTTGGLSATNYHLAISTSGLVTAKNLDISTITKNGSTGYILLYSSTVFDTTGSSSSVIVGFVPTKTSITFTPKSNSSRVEVSWSGCLATTIANVGDAAVTINRGSTNLAGGTNGLCVIDAGLAASLTTTCSGSIMDLPNTASSVTYTIQLKAQSGSSAAVWNAGSLTCIGTIGVKEWGY